MFLIIKITERFVLKSFQVLALLSLGKKETLPFLFATSVVTSKFS